MAKANLKMQSAIHRRPKKAHRQKIMIKMLNPPLRLKTARVEAKGEPESADVGAELEYNIFDPDRSSRQSTETPVKPPEVDRIVLVGALLTDSDCVAFFQGSRSDFTGACSVGDKISDFEVQAIDTERIKLTDGKKSIELEVGQGLARTGNGEWEISEETFSAPVAGSAAETTSSQASAGNEKKDDGNDKASETKGSNSSEDEMLKKMMERRKQETK